MGLAFWPERHGTALGPCLVRVKQLRGSEPSGERQMLGWPVVVPAHRGHRRRGATELSLVTSWRAGQDVHFSLEDLFHTQSVWKE